MTESARSQADVDLDDSTPAVVTAHRAPYNDAVVIPLHVESAIRRNCSAAARALLGPGYVPDYYQQAGADFERVALAAYRQGVRDGRDEQAAR